MNAQRLKSVLNCELCRKKPCVIGCPLDNDIPSIVRMIKNENYEKAFQIFTKTSFLMPICGRICPHENQCEGSCIKKNTKELVKIGNIESFIGDLALKNNWKIKVPKETNYNVAIVGSGPAGLTCAYHLRKLGIGVTIFEKYNYLGGLLVHGIPEFRLEKGLVKKTIDNIINLGIDVKYNMELGKNLKLQELKKNYDAIFLGIGANISNKLHIEGEKLENVYGGNELLENNIKLNLNNKIVTICGAGNVAMDVAMVAKKNGAKEVIIIYRKKEKDMPALIEEVKIAKKEGIKFIFETNIVKILGNNKVTGVELIKTEQVLNKEGKLIVKNIKGTNYKIKSDFVIKAIGSHADNIIRKLKLDLNAKGKIKIDRYGHTSVENIFAGGDLAGVKSTVAWAAKSGRNAAIAIANYLKEENIAEKK